MFVSGVVISPVGNRTHTHLIMLKTFNDKETLVVNAKTHATLIFNVSTYYALLSLIAKVITIRNLKDTNTTDNTFIYFHDYQLFS